MKVVKDFLYKYSCFIGCCLITMIHTGINSVATAAMPYLREYYKCDLSTIIAGASSCSLAMFVAGFVGAKFIRTVKPKGAFWVASICAALYAFLIFITDHVWGFYVGCASVGFTAAWGGYATSNLFIHRFHKTNSATLIAVLSAMSMLGSSGFQFLTGILLTRIGLRGVYFVMICFAGLASVINYLLLDNIEADEESASRFTRTGLKDFEIYKDSKFRRLIIVTLFGSCFGAFGTLCTTFLMSHGLSTEMSTTCLSLYTFCGGLLALISGRLADKNGYRFYTKYLYMFYAFAIVFALIFDKTSSIVVMVLMLFCFASSSPAMSIYNMISKPLFKEKALMAHTQLICIGSLGSAFVLPLLTKVYEIKGFSFLWLLLIGIAFINFILLMSVIPKNNDSNINLI